MLQASLCKTVLGAAVVTALAIGFSGAAQAKTVPVKWTPDFGAPFEELAWGGTADMFIPDTCPNPAVSGWVANSGVGTCAGMAINNGKLFFYQLPKSSSPDPVQTFDLNLYAPQVFSMYITTGGELKGVNSNFIGPFEPDPSGPAGDPTAWFFLKFEKQIAAGKDTSVVQLYYTGVGDDPICVLDRSCNVAFGGGKSVNDAILTVVPEPQTYALMLAGLGVVGFMARRRRQ